MFSSTVHYTHTNVQFMTRSIEIVWAFIVENGRKEIKQMPLFVDFARIHTVVATLPNVVYAKNK